MNAGALGPGLPECTLMLSGFARLSDALLYSHTALVCLIRGILSAYLNCLVLNLEDILSHAFKVLL